MKRELKIGEKVTIILDPLSHGAKMSDLHIDVEILDVQGCPQTFENPDSEQETEIDLDVAVYRVISQKEMDGDSEVDYGNWGSMLGRVQTIIRILNGDWKHTCWPVSVEFKGEN
jgi:hypothetical protein